MVPNIGYISFVCMVTFIIPIVILSIALIINIAILIKKIKNKKKITKSIGMLIVLIILILPNFFFIIVIFHNLDYNGITAKEAQNIISRIEINETYSSSLVEVVSATEVDHGHSEYWWFHYEKYSIFVNESGGTRINYTRNSPYKDSIGNWTIDSDVAYHEMEYEHHKQFLIGIPRDEMRLICSRDNEPIWTFGFDGVRDLSGYSHYQVNAQTGDIIDN